MDNKGKAIVLAFIIFVSSVALGAIKYIPMGERSVFVVRVKDGFHNIVIGPGEETKYEFTPTVGKINGVVAYTDAGYFGKDLQVSILNKDGLLLAKNNKFKKGFSDVRTILSFYFPTIKVAEHDSIGVVIKNNSKTSVSLWGRDLPGKHVIAFSLLERTSTDGSLKNGMYIGVAFTLLFSVAILFFQGRRKTVLIVFILIAVTPLSLAGLWRMDKWGISDWDFYMSVHGAYRKSIVENHVFPFWDPFTAGGTAGLADPEFPVFSPTFIPELIFGVPIGIRLAVMMSVVVGGLGMFRLARELKLGVSASAVTALGFMFGGVNLLEIIEGHVNIYMAMWIPWILWSWLAMVRGKRKPLLCGIFLALTFYGGGIYLLMYTAFAFAGLGIFTARRINTLMLTVKAGLWALGLSAFKLIPVFLWLRNYPDNSYASSVNTLPWLKQIFLERILHGADIIYRQGSGWHEYGAYIGIPMLILALVGFLYARKNKIVWLLLFSAITAILISASGPLLKPLFDVFPYIPRSNISRFVLFAVIPILLLSAYGIEFIQKKIKFGQVVAILAIGVVAVDLLSYSHILSEQAFVLDPVSVTKKADFPIEYMANNNFTKTLNVGGDDVKYSRAYASFLAGYGSTTFPSVLGPDARVKTIEDEKHSYLELENGHGSATLIRWSPNTVIVSVDANESDNLIINANYANGWIANGKPAVERAGRVATRIEQGKSLVTFDYKTPGLPAGSIITLLTLCLIVYFQLRKRPANNSCCFDHGNQTKQNESN